MVCASRSPGCRNGPSPSPSPGMMSTNLGPKTDSGSMRAVADSGIRTSFWRCRVSSMRFTPPTVTPRIFTVLVSSMLKPGRVTCAVSS
jgi:hypothetical protein